MFSEIPSSVIGEIVDLLDKNILNLFYTKKVISILFDKTNKSPLQVSFLLYPDINKCNCTCNLFTNFNQLLLNRLLLKTIGNKLRMKKK